MNAPLEVVWGAFTDGCFPTARARSSRWRGADELAVVESSGRLDSDEAADVELTVSTYGRDDDELACISERWLERWSSVASG